jgi:hypothetical protein
VNQRPRPGHQSLGAAARKIGFMSDDQEKIKIAREYFMRADQGRPDILELFQEDAEVYFPKFDLDLDGTRFLKW